jgi:hypothetical protein
MILDTVDKRISAITEEGVSALELTYSSDFSEAEQGVFTPAAADGVFSVGAAEIVPAPAADRVRKVNGFSIFNRDSAPHRVVVRLLNDMDVRIIWRGLLAEGETLVYLDGRGFERVSPHGHPHRIFRQVPAGIRRCVEPSAAQRILRSLLTGQGTLLGITDTAYWVYVGYLVAPIVAKWVEFHVQTAGAGAQTAEVALASSPLPPNKAAQNMTVLAVSSALDVLTSTGVKRNTIPFMYCVPPGTHLWAGVRTAMATTQPTYRALGFDMEQGAVLQTASPGALTATTYSGAIVAASASHDTPDLRAVLD